MDPNKQLVSRTDLIGYGYAFIVLAGGIMGYVKGGSVPSLAAGVLFGGASAFGAYQMSQNPRNIHVALISSGVLLTVMGLRFYKTGKLMPAGLIAGLSLLQVARLGMRINQR